MKPAAYTAVVASFIANADQRPYTAVGPNITGVREDGKHGGPLVDDMVDLVDFRINHIRRGAALGSRPQYGHRAAGNQDVAVGRLAQPIDDPLSDTVMGDEQAALGIADTDIDAGQGGHLAGPGAGGVYHDIGPDMRFMAGKGVPQPNRPDSPGMGLEANDL